MTRKRLAGAAIALAAVATLIGNTPAGAATENSPWWQTEHDAARSRYNPYETALTPATMSGLQYLRSIVVPPSTGTPPCNASGISDPVLAGNRLYATTDGDLVAYDAATGGVVWRTPLAEDGGAILSAPILSGGRVFISAFDCTSNSDPGTGILAYDQATGAPLWSRSIDSRAESMVAYQGRVFVTGSVSQMGAYDGEVDVYDAATGATVWNRTTRVCYTQDGATVVGQRLLFRACDADGGSHPRLVAANVATGTVAWVRAGAWHAIRGDQPGSAARNLIAKAPDGRIADLNPVTGATRWISSAPRTIGAVDSSQAYGSCTAYRAGDTTCAFRLTDGAVVWQTGSLEIGDTVGALAGGVVYSGGQAINAATGGSLGRLCPYGDTCPVLAVGDGRIVTRSAARLLDLYGRTGF